MYFYKLSALILIVFQWFAAFDAQALNLSGKRGPEDFSAIVEPLLPAVVNISTTTDLKRDRRMEMVPMPPQGGGGTPLEEFFRQFLEENQSNRPRKAVSLGSGFILAQEGETAYVVTCNHVIADADEIKVVLQDDPTEYKATIVGRDRRTDLALLKIKTSKKLVVADWGDSSKSRVGEWIIAIGNPYGLSSTVTTGIISTIARDIGARSRLGAADYVDGYLQTDAPINMGNSGGPMFNVDGKVIAISTAIFSPTGGNIGIGFGIPSNLAKEVIEQLKKFGKTKRGWIGVNIQRADQGIAESFGLKDTKGALVSDVRRGGPAEKAGLKSGDVILKFNGKAVSDSKQLQHLVGETPIGSKVSVEIWRNGKLLTLTTSVAEFEKAEEEGYINTEEEEPKVKDKSEKILGMITKEVTPSTIDRYSLGEDVKGLVVTYVDPGSEAEMKGVRVGDVIVQLVIESTRIDMKKPADLKKFVEKLRKEKKKKVTVLMNSGGNLRYIALSLDDSSNNDER